MSFSLVRARPAMTGPWTSSATVRTHSKSPGDAAAADGGFVWTSRRQQRQFLERLKKFDIDPEKGRINEANLRRMYHSGGQHQKDAITLVCLSQKCSADEAHAMFKKRPTRQEMNQMAAQQARGQKRPHR